MSRRWIGAAMALSGIAALAVGLAACVLLFRPEAFGLSVYRVGTSSMSPGIPPGSAAYVSVRGADVSVGDVVVYEDGSGRKILHRIIGKDADGRFILKGDANPSPDPDPVDPDAVSGRMLASSRSADMSGDFLAFAAMSFSCIGASLVLSAWGLSRRRKYAAPSAGKE